MDNAPDYGSGDSRFDSWQIRVIHFSIQKSSSCYEEVSLVVYVKENVLEIRGI